MLRLLDQVFYLSSLNLLRLSYMLRSSASVPERGGDFGASSRYEDSKLSNINAARELSARFMATRSRNHVAFCCRFVDSFALTVAMTLVIAHLCGHCKQRQRRQEPGITAVNNVEAVTRLNTDVLSEHSSSLLKRLLSLKADAAATVTMDLYPHSATDDAQFLQIGIPYFGNVRISRDDAVSMGASPCATLPSPTRQRRVPANTVVFLPEIQASGCGHTVGQVDGRSDPGILTQIQPLLDEVASEMLLIPQEATWISSSAIKIPDLQACRPSATQLPIAINNALHPQEQTRGSGVGIVGDDTGRASWEGVY
ncbi:hypothetical protein EV356DRAFT_576392, partial [Viridothelium virens]